MRISQISKAQNISFSNQSDYIALQTKQVMRENFNSIEDESLKRISKKISNEYFNVFKKSLEEQRNKTNKNDVRAILAELRNAYSEAGYKDDANAISEHLKTIA